MRLFRRKPEPAYHPSDSSHRRYIPPDLSGPPLGPGKTTLCNIPIYTRHCSRHSSGADTEILGKGRFQLVLLICQAQSGRNIFEGAAGNCEIILVYRRPWNSFYSLCWMFMAATNIYQQNLWVAFHKQYKDDKKQVTLVCVDTCCMHRLLTFLHFVTRPTIRQCL